MGCAASTKEQSERSGLGQLEAKRRCEMGEQSGRMSMSLHEGIVYDPDELIKRLEKLDEERHFIQQQLNRAHNAVELADTSISEEVDVPAVRALLPRTDYG
eukprot:scaffold125875_cov30-Tisochrysis_lutea.AAC.1